MTTFSDLLCSYPATNDVEQFARVFFAALSVEEFTERESSNYVDDRYFVGSLDGMKFKVAYSDDSEHQDLTYWASIESETLDGAGLAARLDELVRAKLLPVGMRVARMENFGRIADERRIDY